MDWRATLREGTRRSRRLPTNIEHHGERRAHAPSSRRRNACGRPEWRRPYPHMRSRAAICLLAPTLWGAIGRMQFFGTCKVEMVRVNDGAARAPHETCLRKTPDPVIG